MEKFHSHFEFFWGKINNYKNFTFARYADGEVMLMKGQAVGTATQAFSVDKWSAPTGITKVGRELIDSLTHLENNYYYAISAPTDNINDYTFLKGLIGNVVNLTFVNLWINSNYEKTLVKFKELTRPVHLICNHKAKKDNFPFKVASITPFPNDCIKFWEESGDDYMLEMINTFTKLTNELIFVSCGPVSEIIIDKLYRANPNNTYVDVGSSIDEFVHGYKTRPYMDSNSVYGKMVSRF